MDMVGLGSNVSNQEIPENNALTFRLLRHVPRTLLRRVGQSRDILQMPCRPEGAAWVSWVEIFSKDFMSICSNPGDPGYEGQPGTAGDDYPTVPAGLGHKSGYGIPSFFSEIIDQQPLQCDPCQRGMPGQQGAKGITQEWAQEDCRGLGPS